MRYAIKSNELTLGARAGVFANFNIWRVFDKDAQAKRIKRLKNHITSDDYFGTLSTVLDLTGQSYSQVEKYASEIKKVNKSNIKKLKELRNDLTFLQEHFKVSKK